MSAEAAGEAALDRQAAELLAERQRAVRLLLTHPMVSDTEPDPATFAVLRREAPLLQQWFAEHLGYRLVVETDLARLSRRPVPGRLPRPALTRSGTAFDPRRYTLLCLLLSALERLEVQTVLSELAGKVEMLSKSEPELSPLDLTRYAERAAFVDAVRFLVELGVLALVAGDEGRFLDAQPEGDALYDIRSRRLAQVLTVVLPPSTVAEPEDLGREIYPDTTDGANRRLRHRLLRRLIEEPALYQADLDSDELAYLRSQRPRLAKIATLLTGLEVEVRQEGLALLDPDGELTDLPFPATGTVPHAALLLGEFLCRRCRELGGEGAVVGRREARAELARLHTRFGRSWSQEYSATEGGLDRLLVAVISRLVAMGLAREVAEGVRPLAALSRFRSREEEDRQTLLPIGPELPSAP